jgi:hypothetical protein
MLANDAWARKGGIGGMKDEPDDADTPEWGVLVPDGRRDGVRDREGAREGRGVPDIV